MKITGAKTIILCAASSSFMLPRSVDGFFFRSSSDDSLHLAPEQASVILQRLSALDSTIAELNKRVEDQQIQIALLKSRLQSSRSLADDECFWSFVNETGTPTCKANYHITAGKSQNGFEMAPLLCLVIIQSDVFGSAALTFCIPSISSSREGLGGAGRLDFCGRHLDHDGERKGLFQQSNALYRPRSIR
jgi:hypothetical protein